jgi:hypothetical protein
VPSFVCESCNDVVKKSTIGKHRQRCDAAAFSCIDCNKTFVGAQVDSHTSCVTEAEKYKHNSFFANNGSNGKSPHAKGTAARVTPAAAASAAAVTPAVTPAVAAASNDADHDAPIAVKRRRTEESAASDVATTATATDDDEDGADLAAVLDEMQEFKWKRSISAMLKQHSSMPLDALSDALIANFVAEFKPKLAQVVKAKVRASKKLQFDRAADGSLIVKKA